MQVFLHYNFLYLQSLLYLCFKYNENYYGFRDTICDVRKNSQSQNYYYTRPNYGQYKSLDPNGQQALVLKLYNTFDEY